MELLPPSGRRSFDIQLECAPPEAVAGGAEGAKPIKMELSMIAAEEFARVAEHLKAKKVNHIACNPHPEPGPDHPDPDP